MPAQGQEEYSTQNRGEPRANEKTPVRQQRLGGKI
jgi:hypothetical protein